MASILLIFILTIKLTTGCNTIAMITEKTNGIRILFAIYTIASKAIKPTRKMATLA